MTPASPGLALRAIAPNVSPAAGAVRVADVSANVGTYEIARRPKSLVDQLNLPCCVSCSLSAAMETLDASWPALAAMFHYHVTRFDNRGADSSGFLYLEDGLATLTNNGVCRQDLHIAAFTDQGAEQAPSATAYSDGATRALGRRMLRPRYQKTDQASRVAWAREQLRQDRPVVIGLRLPSTYMDGFLDATYAWTDPNKFALSGTGHCVLAFGYDDAKQAVHIQDSKGKNKFDQGCWWMGYRVMDSFVVQDAYCLLP